MSQPRRVGVVVSRADSASTHVRDHLLDVADWSTATDDAVPDAEGGGTVHRTDEFELREFDDWHLELEGVADAFDDPAFVVFASRHSGETGPLLTAHFTGNFGEAEYGGRDGELAEACPAAAARAVAALDEHAPEGYDVSTECTHHGPSDVGAPSMFVELGSGEEQWADPEGARAVARAVLALGGVDPHGGRALVAFGGGHYAPRPTRVVRETDWAVGHVGADWCLEALGDPREGAAVVEQAFAQSQSTRAVIDGDRPALEETVEELGHEVVSETWVRETRGVPLALATRLEEAVGPVDDGLRFGDGARVGADADPDVPVTVRDLPGELLAEAHGVDGEAVRGAAAGTALAFETAESGNRVRGRAAFRSAADYDELVARLADVLREKYEAVTRRDDAVVAREVAFDPGAAREAGVPEGPAFGRLADGDPVEVDGRTVTPDAVRRERTREFPV